MLTTDTRDKRVTPLYGWPAGPGYRNFSSHNFLFDFSWARQTTSAGETFAAQEPKIRLGNGCWVIGTSVGSLSVVAIVAVPCLTGSWDS
jgi:hypothetical protein